MLDLPSKIQELSNEGCTDVEAIGIVTELMQVELIKKRFSDELNEQELSEFIISIGKAAPQEVVAFSALGRLSKREHECYLLHTIEQVSMGQISKRLGVSKGAVQQYIDRAREKLSAFH